ncbi:MAG: putative molibdopterin-dependent oxidoreductase YjgC [Parasphingorhabdus sp.]|jgi:predicted molibdopterin-dependent oxidoreductase YjgC
MFKRLVPIANPVQFSFEDQQIIAEAGDSLAAALLAAGFLSFRDTVLSNLPRAPYCMIGNCFECLVEINGMPNQQACRQPARDGMQIRRQNGLPNSGVVDES